MHHFCLLHPHPVHWPQTDFSHSQLNPLCTHPPIAMKWHLEKDLLQESVVLVLLYNINKPSQLLAQLHLLSQLGVARLSSTLNLTRQLSMIKHYEVLLHSLTLPPPHPAYSHIFGSVLTRTHSCHFLTRNVSLFLQFELEIIIVLGAAIVLNS